MGYNATMIIVIDALDQIAKDPDFGKKVSDACAKVSCYGKPVDISSGNHCNAASVIETHHADSSSLIAVGGNYGTVLLQYCGGYSNHTPEDKLNILKEFARQMGYTLHKKKTNQEIADKLHCTVIEDLDENQAHR